MTEPSTPAPAMTSPPNLWARIKQHKVLQWSLAYLGAALALAHAQDLVGHAFHWPEITNQVVIGVLAVGFPVAVALAWYHGHKGLTRISAGEMTVVSVMLVIGAGLLMALVRTPAEHAGSLTPASNPASAPTVAVSTPGTVATAVSTDAPRASIAVVPFANLTGEPAKEYFSDGMAEEMIDSLAHVSGLKVPARTSSFAYKGRNVDIRQIAHDLGVATILEGSVRSAGERIRVTAQLVDGKSGYHLWSQSFDRQFADIFKLQDELATAIVQALRMKLNVDLPATPERTAPTQDVEAYQFYLQASSGSGLDFRQRVALYDQALARDPKFARALAGKANMEFTLSAVGDTQMLGPAERDAAQALALSPDLAPAHAVLGETNAAHGHWVKSATSFRAAIAADPNDGFIRSQHALVLLAVTGQLRQALAEATAGQQLAPANVFCALALAYVDSSLGNDGDALKFADLSAELGGSDMPDVRAAAAVRRGDYSAAIDYWSRWNPALIRDGGGAAVLRLVFSAQSGTTNRAAAREALEAFVSSLQRDEDRATFAPFEIRFSSMTDGLDRAYAIANQLVDGAARSGTVNVGSLFSMWGPETRPFRRDPRFQRLVTRLGLIDYWLQYGPPDDCDLKSGKLACR